MNHFGLRSATTRLVSLAVALGFAPVELMSQSEWVVRANLAASTLHGVHFLNASQGMVVGTWGAVYRTMDGGATWDSVGSGTTNHLYDVWHINQNTIIVVGEGEILRSTDTGNTWVQAQKDTTARFTSISFCDGQNGILAGKDGIIMRTTDGGETWNHQPSGTTTFLSEGVMLNPDTALVVGSEGTILRTTDGGSTWNVSQSGTTNDLLGMAFFDPDTGVVVGFLSQIRRTTDGGATWSHVQSGSSGAYYAVATSGDTMVVVGGGVVLRSVDAGRTWEDQPNNTSGILNDVHLVDGLTGIAVGIYGGVLQTAPGGFTAVAHTSEVPRSYRLEQNFPNPFNPSTNIRFSLPTASSVRVEVFNILGQTVGVLQDGDLQAGYHALEWDAQGGSGVYFYRIVATSMSSEEVRFNAVRKMLLLR